MTYKQIATIFDWIQRLVVLYSNGEEALPRELKPVIKKVLSNDITNGHDLFLVSNFAQTGDIDSVFLTNITGETTTPVGNNIVAKVTTSYLTVSFIVVTSNTEKKWGAEAYFNKDHITIIIDKRVLEVNDTFYTVEALFSLCMDIINSDSSLVVSHRQVDFLLLIPYAFIKSTLNLDDKLTFILNREFYHNSNLHALAAEAYLDKNIDFQSVYVISMIEDLLEKFFSGDLEMWRWLTQKLADLRRETKRITVS